MLCSVCASGTVGSIDIRMHSDTLFTEIQMRLMRNPEALNSHANSKSLTVLVSRFLCCRGRGRVLGQELTGLGCDVAAHFRSGETAHVPDVLRAIHQQAAIRLASGEPPERLHTADEENTQENRVIISQHNGHRRGHSTLGYTIPICDVKTLFGFRTKR